MPTTLWRGLCLFIIRKVITIFFKGIDPYSCGVIADPGYEIANVTLKHPIPWREGFTGIDAYLKAQGQERTALCAIQLRSPAPFTMEGFIDFNRGYCEVLQEWGLYVDELNPLARTNVAPLLEPPSCANALWLFVCASLR